MTFMCAQRCDRAAFARAKPTAHGAVMLTQGLDTPRPVLTVGSSNGAHVLHGVFVDEGSALVFGAMPRACACLLAASSQGCACDPHPRHRPRRTPAEQPG